MDTVIFIAFCFFVVFLGGRIKQGGLPVRKGQTPEETPFSEGAEVAGPPVVQKSCGGKNRRRFIFLLIQLIVLAVLMIYMIPFLIRDFTQGESTDYLHVILRCLIFVFTIYIFVSGVIKVFCKGNKANIGK